MRSLIRIKRYHDTIGSQATELADWNRELEQRVDEQVDADRAHGTAEAIPLAAGRRAWSSRRATSFLESHRCEITVVFCDLRGFVGFAETVEPEVTMAVLREYHAALGDLVFRFDGTLERFTGDGLMVFFNDPLPCPDPSVRAGPDGHRDAKPCRATWQKAGVGVDYELGFSVGIAQGFATLGRVGFEGRFDYAAIGTVTNLAARLCDAASDGRDPRKSARARGGRGSRCLDPGEGTRAERVLATDHRVRDRRPRRSSHRHVSGLATEPRTLRSLTEREREQRFDALQQKLPWLGPRCV